MNDLNSVLLEGNLTGAPELKFLQSGTAVCNFSIAINRFFKKEATFEKEASFFDIEVWGKLAQTCSEKSAKGSGVRVVGRLKQERWTDAQGKTRSKVKVIAEHVEFKPVFRKDGQQESQGNSGDEFADSIPF